MIEKNNAPDMALSEMIHHRASDEEQMWRIIRTIA